MDQHCPAALQLPESVDNATIVNIEQIKAYCNGFSDGQQAAAAHPGVKSYIGSIGQEK